MAASGSFPGGPEVLKPPSPRVWLQLAFGNDRAEVPLDNLERLEDGDRRALPASSDVTARPLFGLFLLFLPGLARRASWRHSRPILCLVELGDCSANRSEDPSKCQPHNQ